MSVLTCSRESCTNIMCDWMINYESYICNECLEELHKIKKTWRMPITEEVILDRIRTFMGTQKPEDYISWDEEEEINKMFNKIVHLS